MLGYIQISPSPNLLKPGAIYSVLRPSIAPLLISCNYVVKQMLVAIIPSSSTATSLHMDAILPLINPWTSASLDQAVVYFIACSTSYFLPSSSLLFSFTRLSLGGESTSYTTYSRSSQFPLSFLRFLYRQTSR